LRVSLDTEPASGNVNKMLLGSFVEEFDESEEIDYTRYSGLSVSSMHSADSADTLVATTARQSAVSARE